MKKPSFESASGLRPASAYLMIGLALVVVCGKSWTLTHDKEHTQPQGTEREDVLPAPDYDIVDRGGKALALSVQRMDLRLSPRAMWQAHTPDEFTARVVEVLAGAYEEQELLERFFPWAEDGVLAVEGRGWELDYESARRVGDWAHRMGIEEHLWLVRDESHPVWRISWRPVELLAREVRRAHTPADERNAIAPITWSRMLADGLARARGWTFEGQERAPTFKQKEERRSRVWRGLLPCADTVAIRGLPPESVVSLIQLLDGEFVQAHQMSIEFEHERVYPPRTDGSGAGTLLSSAFRVLGKWRYLSEEAARARAEAEGVPEEEVERRTRELLARKHPHRGLEGVAARLLQREDFSFIDPRPGIYRYRKSLAVHQPARRYYFGDEAEEATPRVFATLDSELQAFLHGTLIETVEEHDAALAMAMVVEVETGDVLAMDGYSSYEVAEFLPTWHLFTPGSTFKAVVMATALEAGVVHPEDEFETYNGSFRVPGSRRTIGEARNAPTGPIKAWEAISRSSNAVMVQVGMRVDDGFFYRTLCGLGYRERPGSGVGRESLRPFAETPWSPAYTHASISFGHEISISLWQHTQALATILRGGRALPLRTISGVEWGDEYYRLLLEEGDQVYSEDTCRAVRSMLEEGALTGTGRRLTAREAKLGTPIELLSKTGTTEKEAGVACLHLELDRNERNAGLEGGSAHPDFVPFSSLRGVPVPHGGSCYTSSICLAGRVPGSEREVMVLMVVDEPRARKKFGSDVAGPPAIRVLKEALGLTMGGVPLHERVAFVQDYGYGREGEGSDHPWVLHDGGVVEEERSW